jgi:ABC-type Fe3+ transport system permease subunit
MVMRLGAHDHRCMPIHRLGALRYGLPALLVAVGFVILFAVDDPIRWDGWAMCVGSGLSILLLNALFRYGAQGDRERDAEDAAREYLARHGRWPDEEQ